MGATRKNILYGINNPLFYYKVAALYNISNNIHENETIHITHIHTYHFYFLLLLRKTCYTVQPCNRKIYISNNQQVSRYNGLQEVATQS